MSDSLRTLGITALWSALVAAFGLTLIVRDVGTLRVSLRAKPEVQTCAQWAHSRGLGWVRVEGCSATGLESNGLREVAADGGTGWVQGALTPSMEGTARSRAVDGHSARVLTVGEDPRRWSVLGTALLGLLLMSWGMLPWVRRWQAAMAEKRAQAEVYGRHGG